MAAGTLQAWEGLQGLQSLNLSCNPGIYGSLPPDWPTTFPELKVLQLDGGDYGNGELQGTLPTGVSLDSMHMMAVIGA